MTSYRIHVDSRMRDPFTLVSAPTFTLNKSIAQVRGIRVKWCSFSNTVYNIRMGQNDRISISNNYGVNYAEQTYISPGHYTNVQYIAAVNTYLMSVSGGSSDIVTLNEANNKLTWSLPSGMYISGLNSTARNILGFSDNNLAGTFETQLFLAAPMSLSFVCPQLQSTYNVFPSDSLMSRIEPFITVPIINGFGQMNYFEPTNQYFIQLGGGVTLSTLDVMVVDSSNGKQVNELSHWAMELEAFV